MAAVLCLDFDDTITTENIARQIFERFAGPEWRDHEDAYRRGDLSVEQFNAAALDCVDIEVSADAIQAFVLENAVVRPGLLELADWAHWNDWQIAIVSNGFDLYLDPVLDRFEGIRAVRHCGRTSKQYRWRVRYLSPRGIEVQSGFKIGYAAAFNSAGDFVAYGGDGASDVAAARLAAAVFARSTLWDELKDEHPRIYPFETFDDVRAILDRESANWLRSFSSTTAAEG